MDTPTPREEADATVRVDHETVRRAVDLTGIEEPDELVDFALRLLVDADPSADYARGMRENLQCRRTCQVTTCRPDSKAFGHGYRRRQATVEAG